MTIYARSDICTVNIGPAHGGCGQLHERPSGASGQPVQPWGLTCASGCEGYLRKDTQMWATSVAEIPATFDEAKEREQIAARGNVDRDNILALALAKLAGLDMAQLPASVTGPALAAAPIQGLIACPSCQRAQSAGGSYCAGCGSPMRGPAPAASIAAAS